MKSVITGDIIQSQKISNPEIWLIPIKKLFQEFGQSPEIWEIYRGDSFQIMINEPEKSLLAAIRIKSIIKTVKNIDVRMAIGIGEVKYMSDKITESNGDAFIFSGQKFEDIKNTKQNLAVKTPWENFDKEINLILKLALIAMDNWSSGSAEVVSMLLTKPELTQKDISEKLGIRQSSVSDRLKRSYFSTIQEMQNLFSNKLIKQIFK